MSGDSGLFQAFLNALHLLLEGDAALWDIVALSMRTSIFALLIASPFAIVCGYAMAVSSFRGRRFLVWLLQTSLAFPTVLIGLLLYMLLSRHGALGQWHWLFTSKALVAGQTLMAFPIIVAFVMSAVQSSDPRLAETAVCLGASPTQVMWRLLLECRFAVVAALIHAFGRVISEVGCAMMVGGNIAGATRTMTTAIALETSKGEFAQGIALGFVLLCSALLMNAALLLVQGDLGKAGSTR